MEPLGHPVGEAASDVVGVDAVVEEVFDLFSDVSDDAAGGSFGAAVEPFADEGLGGGGWGVRRCCARRRSLRFSFLYQKTPGTFYTYTYTYTGPFREPFAEPFREGFREPFQRGLLGFVDLLFCGFGVQGFAVTPSVAGVGVGNGLVERVGRPFLAGLPEPCQEPFGKGVRTGFGNPFDEGAGALSALGRQFVDGEPRQLITEHSAQGGGHGGLDVAERGLEYVRLFPQSVVADESAHEDFFGVLVYDHVPVRVEAFQGG